MRHQKLPYKIYLYDRESEVRDEARQLGLGDQICDNIETAVSGAGLIIMAVPVGAMKQVMTAIAPYCRHGAIITDTGSTKRSVLRDCKGLVPQGADFIPSHPLAGTEFSGPSSGFASLFQNRYWLILPNNAEPEKVAALERLVTSLGAKSEQMDADYHDRVLAITSHLPHLIAYTIVSTAVALEQDMKNDVIRFSASGFRDFTRIAASDPVMWRDIFINNDQAVLEMLQRFSEDLSVLQRAIRWKEGETLFDLFTRTRDIRRSIIDAGQD